MEKGSNKYSIKTYADWKLSIKTINNKLTKEKNRQIRTKRKQMSKECAKHPFYIKYYIKYYC